jgi:hypothetical protein
VWKWQTDKPKRKPKPSKPRPKVFIPTPQDIAAACLEIQATWTPREERERRTHRPARWELPKAVPPSVAPQDEIE